MADTKKEHYVPQCYLKNFVNENERIAVFDKLSSQVRYQKTTDIAMENYFYDIDFNRLMDKLSFISKCKTKAYIRKITGIRDWKSIGETVLNKKYIEKQFFGNLENSYSQLLKTLISKSYGGNSWVINNCFSMSIEEKKRLAEYIAIQIIRTKTTREEIGQMIEKMHQAIAYKSQAKNSDALPKELFEVQVDKDYVKLQHSAMILDPKMLMDIAECLNNHIWIMYINKTYTPFYTSDNPVAKIPHKFSKYISYNGFNSEGIEVLFPISPTLLLAMYERKSFENIYIDRTFLNITETEHVDYFNRAQLVSSFRCVYSKEENFELAKTLCKQYPELTSNDNLITVG